MRLTQFTVVISLALGIFACEKASLTKETTSPDDKQKAAIVLGSVDGYWIRPNYEEDTVTYSRANTLPENAYGIAFHKNKQVVERKNVGWCGTPPVVYGDFEGNWVLNDSILTVEVGYWGGTSTLQWQVLSVGSDELVLRHLHVLHNDSAHSRHTQTSATTK